MDYKVAVGIVLQNGVSPGLALIAQDLAGLRRKVGDVEQGFGSWKFALGGVLAMLGVEGVLGAIVKVIDKTKEFSDELVKLERLGGAMQQAVVSGDMTKQAFDIAQRVPMKVTDLLKIPGASYSILGQEDSMKVWEQLARFQFAMSADKDFKGDAGDDLAKFLRSGELAGRLTDPHT